MGIDADRVSRQTEQLRSTGVLVVPESPSRQWGILLGCVVFTMLSIGLLALANQSDSSLQFMVGGIAGVVFFGVGGIPAVVRKILRRGRLVVTPEGLRLERRSGQSYVVNESARWTEIAEFFGEQISSGGGPRAQLVTGYVLTPQGQRARSHDAAAPQLSQRANELVDRGTLREGRVYLPAMLEGGSGELLAVLQQAHRYYGGSRASDGWNGPGR